MSVLIKRGNPSELLHVVRFLWTLREGGAPAVREEAFELWPLLLDGIDLTTEDGASIASSLSRWSVFVDRVDQTTIKWLLSVAPYAGLDYNDADMFESLARVSRDQPLEAQEVWIEMVRSHASDYPEDAIKELTANLVHAGPDGLRRAREVVDVYLEAGNDRPRSWLVEVVGDELPGVGGLT